MMKNRILIFFALVAAIATMASCSKDGGLLDQVKTTDLNEATTFADSARTMQFLTRVYDDIGFSADPKRFATLTSPLTGTSIGLYDLCDEVESSLQAATAYNIIFQTGAVSAINIPDDAWNVTYANIRRVNVFLSHIKTTPLSVPLQTRLTGEARFLRAWYYFILIKHYGGVPLIGDVVYTAADNIPGKRATYDACVSYIESECMAAANLLPVIQSGLDYGRITKGACLGLRSRLLLYAASPLFNGRGDLNGILGYPTADPTRWNKAAQAAQDVITLSGTGYQLVDLTPPATAAYAAPYNVGYGFQRVFVTRKNPEYILAAMAANNRTLESFWDPPTRTGTGSVWPYQELVDSYGTINGKPITTDIKTGTNPNGYDATNPYVNRDPRFYWSIIYNGAKRLDITKAVSAVSTVSGAGSTADGTLTKTGYFLRKLLDDNTIASSTSSTSERCFPLIRYAEILLNYAEASNEAGDIATAYTQLIAIRKRAGINPGSDNLYGLTAGLSKDDMRIVIQGERRVELAIEEHRYWDVRRWKIAENVSNKPLHGVVVTQTGSTFTYTPTTIRTPVFTAPKWYLWPIPQSEINKSVDLVQNPGW